MENNIPTAEEIQEIYLDKYGHGDVTSMLIEFAKLHVEAALKAASENAETINEGFYGRSGETEDYYEVNKDSILNAYTLENIK